MLEFFQTLNVWLLALIIIGLRVVDVTLGTIRTISVVQGRTKLAVVLGFFEVLIWVSVVSQVIVNLGKHPILAISYALGYALGNAVGIIIEKNLAMGTSVLQLISTNKGTQVADQLRSIGQAVTTFKGEGRDGHCTLLFVTCARKDLKTVINEATKIDPKIFYIFENISHVSTLRQLQKDKINTLPWNVKKK